MRNTQLTCPPLTPELRLHLADKIDPVWRALQMEVGDGDAPPPYWAFAWVGGQAIARYLLDEPKEVAGTRVVDMAAGSGICAIAAMRAGAGSALAADIDPFCGDAVALNAEANGVTIAYTGRNLLHSDPPQAEVILAGDVCYEKLVTPNILSWLIRAHQRGIRVLLGDPGREYFPRNEMIQLAECLVPTARDLEGTENKTAGVFTFRSPVSGMTASQS